VSYVALRSGRYSLHIKLGDEPIAGSPYFLRIEPGTPPKQHFQLLLLLLFGFNI
jgi:hypothetical protein